METELEKLIKYISDPLGERGTMQSMATVILDVLEEQGLEPNYSNGVLVFEDMMSEMGDNIKSSVKALGLNGKLEEEPDDAIPEQAEDETPKPKGRWD